MNTKLKRIMIGTFTLAAAITINIGPINAEELDSNNNENVNESTDIIQTVDLTGLNTNIEYANQILTGDTTVFQEASLSNLQSLMTEITNNFETIKQNQTTTDEYQSKLNNAMLALKVKESVLSELNQTITKADEILNNASNYDEDDITLLQNMKNEAINFISDYNTQGIVIFLPNYRSIGQIATEVKSEPYRLATKIKNAIDRLELKPVSLPNLSSYDGESIAKGLNEYYENENNVVTNDVQGFFDLQLNKTVTFSIRDMLYAKVGFSDAYFGNARQNITLLNYLKGMGANTLDLELYISYAKSIIDGNKYNQESLKKLKTALENAEKFLNKFTILGVKVLPTKQDKVDELTNNLLNAIKNIELIEVANPSSNALNGTITTPAKELSEKLNLSDKVITNIINGNPTLVYIDIKNIDSTISDTEKTKINNTLSENEKIGAYLDINLFAANNQITETNGKIKISLTIPTELKNTNSNITRTYYIIRLHGDEIYRIPVVLDDDTITFESDKFSTYALTYVDTKKSNNQIKAISKSKINNPQTNDNIIFYVLLTIISTLLITSRKTLVKVLIRN